MIAARTLQTRERLTVYTHLGRGEVVYHFPSGQVAVEFEHGGGQIFDPGQVRLPRDRGQADGTLGADGSLSGGLLPG